MPQVAATAQPRALPLGIQAVSTNKGRPGCLGLSLPSARVFCSRATARGDLVRKKHCFYVMADWLPNAAEEDVFRLSNHLPTAVYLFLLSALSRAGISTQVPGSRLMSQP